MTRKNLFFLVIAFVVGVSVWLFYVNKSMKETQKIIVEQAERPNRNIASLPPQTATPDSAFKARLQSEFVSMQEKLEQERQKLEAQRVTLENLKARQQEQPATSYSSLISTHNEQIRDFLDELNGYEKAEADINRRANDILREQSSQAQVARDQIDDSVRVQETLMRQTQEELTYWQYTSYMSAEREARMQELQSLIEAQRQDLENLKAQKLNISTQVLANTQAVQSEKEQALNELAANRADLRDEISSLRDEVYRMQEAQYKVRTSQVSLNSQIIQTQRAYDEQEQIIKNMEATLRQKADEINLLK